MPRSRSSAARSSTSSSLSSAIFDFAEEYSSSLRSSRASCLTSLSSVTESLLRTSGEGEEFPLTCSVTVCELEGASTGSTRLLKRADVESLETRRFLRGFSSKSSSSSSRRLNSTTCSGRGAFVSPSAVLEEAAADVAPAPTAAPCDPACFLVGSDASVGSCFLGGASSKRSSSDGVRSLASFFFRAISSQKDALEEMVASNIASAVVCLPVLSCVGSNSISIEKSLAKRGSTLAPSNSSFGIPRTPIGT
mmetsp:Transcript_16341/g.31736  ORF Transcript_16341/g.31736 Transcript_16341/m.31736 type:complete len:250 (-) Transcript_16341:1469-2218(-)